MIKVGDTVRIGTYSPAILSVIRAVWAPSEMAELSNGWRVPMEQLTVEEPPVIEPPVGFEMRTRGGWHRYRVSNGWMSWNDGGLCWSKYMRWDELGSSLRKILSDEYRAQNTAKHGTGYEY